MSTPKSAPNARAQKRLHALVARVRDGAKGDFYAVGEALREIVDDRLYLADGHRDLDALLSAGGLMSRRQAGKLTAVARGVTREEAHALGSERAYALVTYAAAAGEDVTAAALLAGDPTLREASVRAIEAMAREARRRRGGARTQEDELVTALRGALKSAGVGRVNLTRGRVGVRLSLSDAQAKKLSRALGG